jgi:hypothetical protein
MGVPMMVDIMVVGAVKMRVEAVIVPSRYLHIIYYQQHIVMLPI